jgi:ribosomal protein L30/L7E
MTKTVKVQLVKGLIGTRKITVLPCVVLGLRRVNSFPSCKTRHRYAA